MQNHAASTLTSLAVDLGSGLNRLTIDASNGLILTSAGVISFEGKTGFNELFLTGTPATPNTFSIYDAGPAPKSGLISEISAGGGMSVNFEDVDSVFSDIPSNLLIVNGTSESEAISYGQGTFLGSVGSVAVGSFPALEFGRKTTLLINGVGGSDEISLNNPTVLTGLTSITVNGGDPTASDTLVVNGTAATVAVNTASQSITGVAGPGVTVNYSTIEHLTVNAAGVSNKLQIGGTGFAGGTDYTVVPAVALDEGDVLTPTIPVHFIGFGVGDTLQLDGDGGGTFDLLTVNGTDANDGFSVTSSSAVSQTGRVFITQTNMDNLIINGLGGDDSFNVISSSNFNGINIIGGDPSAGDTLNFVSNVGAAITLTPGVGVGAIQQSGFGGVGYVGIERVNVTANAAVVVTGTLGDDTINVQPTAAGSGNFTFSSAGARRIPYLPTAAPRLSQSTAVRVVLTPSAFSATTT